MAGPDLQPLFAPLTVRGLTVANRFVMSPMTREFSPDGVPGPDVAAYYARRATGGVGLIITEGCAVDHPLAVDRPGIPGMSAATVPAWRTVVDQVHASGGRIAVQLWHQGPIAAFTDDRRMHQPLTPSEIWGPQAGVRSMAPDHVAEVLAQIRVPASDAELIEVVAAFGRSAAAARAAGFDAIALHGAHGYLIDAFLWHETNLRRDEWGGAATGRARLACEIVRAVRAAAGEALPIIFRFSQWKMQDFKARLAETPAELEALLTPIAEAGVDVFDASQRYFDTPVFAGSSLNLAGWAKALTGRLAMTVGGVGLNAGISGAARAAGVSDPSSLDQVIARHERGEFDLVGVGRALLHDPAWVHRVRTGEPRRTFDPESFSRLT
jgi:2,4-dienoyl-CoA reductase-like NADH-dependent reductase (Old Yellow Enzyme family)